MLAGTKTVTRRTDVNASNQYARAAAVAVAVVRFQQTQGLRQSGTLEAQTLSALGVAR